MQWNRSSDDGGVSVERLLSDDSRIALGCSNQRMVLTLESGLQLRDALNLFYGRELPELSPSGLEPVDSAPVRP